VKDCRVEILKGSLFGMGKKQDIGGSILDMSDSGMRFVCRERLALGSSYKVILKHNPIALQMDLKATVKWATLEDGKIVVGVEFDDPSDEHRGTIGKLREKMKQYIRP
jgi:hypothetical protein